MSVRSVLWWGRFDPEYSRNRVLRKQFVDLGWRVADFRPWLAQVGDWEAQLRRVPTPDLVWVPCFRQRDLAAASRWARSKGIPLVFDPLISAYDKQVDERGKLDPASSSARKLLAWERGLFRRADRIIADTPAHADYFERTLGVQRAKIDVVYVGAEKALFRPAGAFDFLPEGAPIEVLFYGSFIPLQGPQTVVEAALRYEGPPVKWVLLGQGPLRPACEALAGGNATICFEDWLPYAQLPQRIRQATILLGVFGRTPKAGRVIPNKVFQSLACGKAVITRVAEAYPADLRDHQDSGIEWVPAGDARALSEKVAMLAGNRDRIARLGQAAAATSDRYFSEAVINQQLEKVLARAGVAREY